LKTQIKALDVATNFGKQTDQIWKIGYFVISVHDILLKW
jgi:hypothetical protein